MITGVESCVARDEQTARMAGAEYGGFDCVLCAGQTGRKESGTWLGSLERCWEVSLLGAFVTKHVRKAAKRPYQPFLMSPHTPHAAIPSSTLISLP